MRRPCQFGCVMMLALALAGCADQNSLTREQIKTQNRADAFVSGVLFDHDLDSDASYNIHKDGFLVIKFDDQVSAPQYNSVVEELRASKLINGVRAEQGGQEVCPISQFRSGFK